MNKFNLLVAFLFASIVGFSQQSNTLPPQDTSNYPYWIEMMQDPSVNFFSVQSAFNKYWENRPVTRSKGWKPFKRWEYMMQNRVSPTGERPANNAVLKAYQKYLGNADGAKSLSGNWVSLGPSQIPLGKGYKGLGRVNAVAFHPNDPQTIYIGAPSGGLWVSTDAGSTWSVLTDHLLTLGVSAIAVDYTNPQTIYIGTGDRDAGDAPGLGVWKSVDGGINWLPYNLGMEDATIGKLLIHPTNHSIIFAAASNGFYKSTDGGFTWTLTSMGNYKDLVIKPGNPSVLYAGVGGKFYRSEDEGETWTWIHNGIPAGSRAAVAITPANPEVVYVLLASADDGFKGLYKSTDSGLNFTVQSTSPNIMDWSCDGSGSGGQGWYDLALAADPNDESLIYVGGVDIWKSYNSGIDWQITAHWYGGCDVTSVHADHHVFEYSPVDGKLYIGCDGGVYWTNNEGVNWTEISSGLIISQAYKIGQSATKTNLCINGYQDNGTSAYDGGNWYAINGGDGMECAVDPVDSHYRYSTLYYGSIYRHFNNGGGEYITDVQNGVNETGGWVTPFIIDKNDANTMFVGYKSVHRSNNIKASPASSVEFVKISESMAGGDLTILCQSYANTDVLYVASGNNLFRTDNCHADSPAWLNMSESLPATNTITAIETNLLDENIVYMAQQTKLFRSSDKGLTWVEITGALPEVNINTIIAYRHSLNGIYVGTDAGVYYKDGTFCGWVNFTNGLPLAARITELEIYHDDANPVNDRIKAGTYGRGLWESDMYRTSPMADFIADQSLIPPGCSINFTDLSSGVPFAWQWNFDGGTPSVSTARSPQQIFYNTPGVYNVQLIVSNDQGIDTLFLKNYIHVSDTLLPEAGFYADKTAFCAGDNAVVSFTDTTKFCPSVWNWQFDPATVTFVNNTSSGSQNPQVQFDQVGNYDVTLIASNANGSNSQIQTRCINVGGYTIPFSENFDQGLNIRSWTVENPDNNITWSSYANVNTYPGDLSAFMNFFNYHSPPGKRDRLISPVLDLTGEANVHLNFKHAYAKQYESITDSLIVYISTDCGTNWTRIFAAGDDNSGSFATHPLTTEEFIPLGTDDWCDGAYGSACNTIDITPWSGGNNVKIAFESFNYYGNNLFLDEVSITNGVGIGTIVPQNAFVIYPNPASGLFTLQIQQPDVAEVHIYNIQGQEVKRLNFSGTGVTFNLSEMPKGVYVVKCTTSQSLVVKRIIVE
ncbi:MAG: PKD domain-containing protein [Lentimicrobiaceae bacterium]|nr:PKD domain-containing protein [Lentimicrobiaceae bacterium]